jgi:hypothetical protein
VRAVKAREPRPSLKGALTSEQFCAVFCLSPELHAALKRLHLAPREVRTDHGARIPLESMAQWRCEIEGLHTFARRWLRSASRNIESGHSDDHPYTQLYPDRFLGTCQANKALISWEFQRT